MKIIHNDPKNKQVIHQLDGITEFIELAQKGKRYASPIDKSEFRGHINWSKAEELANIGWPEGHAKVKASLNGLIKTDRAFEEEQLVRSQCGAMFDIPDFLAGLPEPCFDFAVEEGDKSVVKIGSQISAQSCYSAEAFANRGAVAVALVDALSTARVPVELWAYTLISGDSKPSARRPDPKADFAMIQFPLKRATEPLDIDVIAYVLGHAGFYRHIGFGAEYHFCRNEGETYGQHPNSAGSFDIAGLGENKVHDFDVFTPYSSKIESLDYCKKWLIETCEKLDVNIELN